MFFLVAIGAALIAYVRANDVLPGFFYGLSLVAKIFCGITRPLHKSVEIYGKRKRATWRSNVPPIGTNSQILAVRANDVLTGYGGF